MPESFVAPEVDRPAFHCPWCGAFAHQAWGGIQFLSQAAGYVPTPYVSAHCAHCNQLSIWREGVMVHPDTMTAPVAPDDLPYGPKVTYDEARGVMPRSSRAAAALLRLCLEQLVDELAPGAGSLNEKIGALVKMGMAPRIQQSMDVLRVVGNNAVHPGTIDVNDEPAITVGLFELVHIVVDAVITQPAKIDALYATLPDGAKNAIDRRDG